jgi:DNA-binding FadR family transcriptional regulator
MRHRAFHRKLYEYLVEEIGQKIVDGDFKPGDTLPNETSLCQTYGVSRGVLREATKVLTQKGLIDTRPKIGTQIQARTQWNLFDSDILIWTLKSSDKRIFLQKVTEVRRIIESEACRYAAKRATDTEMAVIQSRYDEMEAALNDPDKYDYNLYLEKDMAFHTSILDACHNELLAQIGHTMRKAVQLARKADIRDIETQRASLPLHTAILLSLQEHRAEAAHQASQAMFDKIGEMLPASAENTA